MHDFGQWCVCTYTAPKGAVRQFGASLWGNDARAGFQINVWRWEFQIMREHE